MPYVTCDDCKLMAFSAAYRWQPDFCARCGAELPRPRSASARVHESALAQAARTGPRRPGTALQHTRRPA
jgi:hypothetical protein